MSAPTVNVTVRMSNQNGEPVSGARVQAKLTTTERYNGYVVPNEVTALTGADGTAVLALFPNELGSEGSEYLFKMTDTTTGKTVKVYAVIPNVDCELQDITELQPYERIGAGAIVSTEVLEARDKAVLAASIADEKSSISIEKALESTLAAESANNSASAALESANNASGSAQSAADSASSAESSNIASSDSMTKAMKWSEEDFGVEVETGKYSAKHYATVCQQIVEAGPVASVNGKIGVVVLNKSDIGLGNVDNTSDLNKPISTATQTALDGKLGLTATAADSAKLGGVAPDGYVKKADINGMVGNLSAPLTHLPLKKNLLTAQGQSIVTFTRTTTGTYLDRYGVVKTAAIDTPRFEKEGLLIEGASTNLLTYSEQFDNVAWTKTGVSVSANATTAPDGALTADKLVEDTTASNVHHTHAVSYNATNTILTASVYAKAGERTDMKLQISNFSSEAAFAQFNLSTGIVTDIFSSIYDYTNVKASMQAVGDGWYRCMVTATKGTVNSTNKVVISLSNGTTPIYTGDGVSGIYIWGAQLEALPFATSYIPTTTTTVTRGADNCYADFDSNHPSLKTGTAFSYVMNFDTAPVPHSAPRTMLSIYSAGNLYSHFRVQSTHTFPLYLRNATNIGTSSSYYSARSGIVVDSNNLCSVYKNGAFLESRTDTLLQSITTPTQIRIGNYYSSGHLYGHVSDLKIYDRALTAAEMRIA